MAIHSKLGSKSTNNKSIELGVLPKNIVQSIARSVRYLTIFCCCSKIYRFSPNQDLITANLSSSMGLEPCLQEVVNKYINNGPDVALHHYNYFIKDRLSNGQDLPDKTIDELNLLMTQLVYHLEKGEIDWEQRWCPDPQTSASTIAQEVPIAVGRILPPQ